MSMTASPRRRIRATTVAACRPLSPCRLRLPSTDLWPDAIDLTM
jgi:hypothetical protein